MNNLNSLANYIYTYACREEEQSLCQLELRSLFDMQPPANLFRSNIFIDPSRSPFIKERIELLYEGDSLSDILEQVQEIDMLEATFKVIFVKTNDLEASDKIEFADRRAIEREMGLQITGESDVHHPDHQFGLVTLGGRWYFGHYVKNKAVWLHHMKKPRSYSIALSTRVARAAVNIAIPNPDGIKAIDPCCGIGTALIEALSMGIDIVGGDINPFIARGARENIAHFGFQCEVTLGAIASISEHYDVAIIDMPYNVLSTTTPDEQLSILLHTRRIATKAVIITSETIDDMIADAGLTITDRCEAKKGNFTRQILVCA
ncbi:TRM11 family SAM-dependent methyltransferase [Paenibacillus segetis]|uniref:Methyltransferase n=1 Tax=Paenibacillus segetis TaxID=1325360 RepID=A0ABQ1YMH3_9BACL|nr:RNA methyltransferase [Paenibacillus segetis]GGH31715.1 methyltransferase [Paenibacillus segetis]